MRHLMSPLDLSVDELNTLLDLASDIEKHPDKSCCSSIIEATVSSMGWGPPQ